MIEHQISWYESDDGKIFTDEMECLEHELNFKYHASGVTFYIGDKKVDHIIAEDDQTYQEITDIFIDRSKVKENEDLLDLIRWDLGWSYIVSALEGTGTHYTFTTITTNGGIFETMKEVTE